MAPEQAKPAGRASTSYEFTSPCGYELGDVEDGVYKVWARFHRDPGLDTPDGGKGYRCVTTDAAVARRLRKIEDITETKAARKQG